MTRAEARIVPYAPGVRIDWAQSVVELDARIVLRQGPLELFACTPQTREHESIVVVRARPRRIFEALGLIGLEPGAPVQWDSHGTRRSAAWGAALRVDVVLVADGAEQVFGIHEWMQRAADGAPLKRRDWVFSGSRRLSGDRLASDLEGTVICVVDFASALIALPETHTASDAALWLHARTERIPPLGTACVIRISSAERGRTLAHLGPSGTLRMAGRVVTVDDLERHVRSRLIGDSGAHVVLVAETAGAEMRAVELEARLTARGLEVVVHAAARTPTPPSPAPTAVRP